ncbi:MAG TPA: VWA domain-containing protein [Bryobacteraceae bacterium]|jgi:VWFA-related protein
MSLLRVSAAATVCGLFLSVPGVPQENPQPPAKQGEPNFRITIQHTEVIIPVTVRDEKGKYVSNLVKDDFRVLDEGKPQKIDFFSHAEKQPVVVGFLIDQSNAMKIHWKTYQDAIKELIWNLLPGDKRYTGYLITFSNDAELAVNTTWDSDKLAAKVDKMKPAGGAAFYDAIYMACTRRDLVKGEPYEPRRIIVIVGDGHDSSSKHTQEEVLELAQRNMVTVYAVSTQSFGFANEDKDTLERITKETGGHVEYPLDNPYKDVSGYLSHPSDEGNYALTVGTGGYAAAISKGIIDAVGGIANEIVTQYVLRYVPDFDDPKPKVTRRLKVDIPSLPGVRIDYRQYYYPNPVPGAPASGGNQ